MRTIKYAVMALVLGASAVTYAVPGKHHKAKDQYKVARVNSIIGKNGTVVDENGDVLGKLDSKGQIINSSGQLIGRMARSNSEKIGQIYFSD